MPAARFNIVIEEGADFHLEVVYQDEDCTIQDLTGWGARAQVREDGGNETLIYDFTEDNGRLKIVGSEGRVVLDMGPNAIDGRPIDFESALWGLELYRPDGGQIRLLQGRATFSPEVVR